MKFVTLTETSVGIETAETNEVIINIEKIYKVKPNKDKFRSYTEIYISPTVFVNVQHDFKSIESLVKTGSFLLNSTIARECSVTIGGE